MGLAMHMQMQEVLQPVPCAHVFMHCHQEAHTSGAGRDLLSDTLGTDVLHCLCQEEAQDAIDPIGIAVNKFGDLAYRCRIWEEAFSLTQKGIALEEEVTPCCRSMCW